MKSAGLPNITSGSLSTKHIYMFGNSNSGNASYNHSGTYGPFEITKLDNPGIYSGEHAFRYHVDFNASRCSSIFGNSTTVQPNSYTVLYIMKIKA